MADVKISALPVATTPLSGAEILPIVQGGVTTQVSVSNLTATLTASTIDVNANTGAGTAAVTITQIGAGNALLVEDSASTDSTPFLIDTAGRVILGTTSAVTLAGSTPGFQIHSTAATQAAVAGWGTITNQTPLLNLYRSASGTIGTQGAVASGFDLGAINFFGDDGTSFLSAAQILAEVDGAVATTDMPSRLTFSTRPSGAGGVLTERMRINNAGNVGIGATNPTARLNVVDATSQDAVRITQTGAGNALVVEDSANPDSSPFVVAADGNVIVGTTTPASTAYPLYVESIVGALVSGGTNTAATSPTIGVSRRRTSLASVVNGDSLGKFSGFGWDGAAFVEASRIETAVDGTPGTNDMPGRLVFSTTADGASTPTERMRITNLGNVCIGTTAAGTSAEEVLAIGTGVAPTTGPADTIQIYSTDLSAGNTMLSIYTEGTSVNVNATAAATHRIAVRINGTVYYLLANTAA